MGRPSAHEGGGGEGEPGGSPSWSKKEGRGGKMGFPHGSEPQASDSSCGGRGRNRPRRLDVRPLPQLERDETPEPVPVVGAAVGVLSEQALDGRALQLAAL